MTRRRLLGAAAGMAAAAASALLPPNLRRALAQPAPRQGSLRDIKHVVLLMQENRSFDHYFGTLAGVRGFGDDKAMTLPNGKSVFFQPDPENPPAAYTCYPFHRPRTLTERTEDTPFDQSHAWSGATRRLERRQDEQTGCRPTRKGRRPIKKPFTSWAIHTREDVPVPVRPR